MATENEIAFNPPRIGFCFLTFFLRLLFAHTHTQPGSFFVVFAVVVVVLFRNGVYWCVFRTVVNNRRSYSNKIQHRSARISHFMLSLAVLTYFYAFKLCTYLYIYLFFFGYAVLPITVLPVLRFYTHIIFFFFYSSLLSICVDVCVLNILYSNIYS